MFKDKLKKLIKQHNMTQEDLAEKLYVSKEIISVKLTELRLRLMNFIERVKE